jgi:hypothetical protein
MTSFAKHLALRTIPEPNSGCLLWTGGQSQKGYGAYLTKKKWTLAHRASWEHHRGPIPAGLFVCHKCDVRLCVNPDHLFLGTGADNVADMDAKGRRAMRKGEAHPLAKLTNSAVVAIRADTRSIRRIAASFGVSSTAIRDIKNRKSWGHI